MVLRSMASNATRPDFDANGLPDSPSPSGPVTDPTTANLKCVHSGLVAVAVSVQSSITRGRSARTRSSQGVGLRPRTVATRVGTYRSGNSDGFFPSIRTAAGEAAPAP